MNKIFCSKCKQNPAAIFVSKNDGDNEKEGLCIKCALEMNIVPVKDILDKMGATENDIDAMNEEFKNLLTDF